MYSARREENKLYTVGLKRERKLFPTTQPTTPAADGRFLRGRVEVARAKTISNPGGTAEKREMTKTNRHQETA